ncbi:adenosine deaminase [Hortaea werneckii]|nr:adenosine deaminase [Hortaea werneckii]KAI6883204.1 adenosine deaminase [Hortaea werneckii]KAI6992071.1 adenosine deaminase [Hortaea werneckii]KAI7144561.1 adenosine deaminase [Hortaea werneckii]KAI7173107.1 adenosine deaminase [Hortaea werneckii]
MCKSDIHNFLKALPKCEHHMHLEGALTPAVLFKLAEKNQIALPTDDVAFTSPETLAERYNQFTSLDDFLHYYYIGMSVLVDSADYEALAWDYFQHASADGLWHAEVFFDPQAHLDRGVSYDTVLSGFMAARDRAQKELDISSELICCFLRHLPASSALETFKSETVQASIKNGKIIGIGLDSSEAPFPPELFTEVYEQAQALGLRRTAHAGEEGPPAYIERSLTDLKVERVDHGIRLVEDDSLLQRIAERQILLTVCPVSNVLLRCVSSVSELPLRKFLDMGVRFSINSDDPAYFGTNYILDNYCVVQKAFNFGAVEWEKICENAIHGSWCSAERKGAMLAKLKSVVHDQLAMGNA